MSKEVFGTSERQIVTHDYFIPNFLILGLAENLEELRGF